MFTTMYNDFMAMPTAFKIASALTVALLLLLLIVVLIALKATMRSTPLTESKRKTDGTSLDPRSNLSSRSQASLNAINHHKRRYTDHKRRAAHKASNPMDDVSIIGMDLEDDVDYFQPDDRSDKQMREDARMMHNRNVMDRNPQWVLDDVPVHSSSSPYKSNPEPSSKVSSTPDASSDSSSSSSSSSYDSSSSSFGSGSSGGSFD